MTPEEVMSRCYEHGQPDYVLAGDTIKALLESRAVAQGAFRSPVPATDKAKLADYIECHKMLMVADEGKQDADWLASFDRDLVIAALRAPEADKGEVVDPTIRRPEETGEEYDHRQRMAGFTPEQRALVYASPAADAGIAAPPTEENAATAEAISRLRASANGDNDAYEDGNPFDDLPLLLNAYDALRRAADAGIATPPAASADAVRDMLRNAIDSLVVQALSRVFNSTRMIIDKSYGEQIVDILAPALHRAALTVPVAGADAGMRR